MTALSSVFHDDVCSNLDFIQISTMMMSDEFVVNPDNNLPIL